MTKAHMVGMKTRKVSAHSTRAIGMPYPCTHSLPISRNCADSFFFTGLNHSNELKKSKFLLALPFPRTM